MERRGVRRNRALGFHVPGRLSGRFEEVTASKQVQLWLDRRIEARPACDDEMLPGIISLFLLHPANDVIDAPYASSGHTAIEGVRLGIARQDRTRSDDRVRADSGSRQDNSAVADEHVVENLDLRDAIEIESVGAIGHVHRAVVPEDRAPRKADIVAQPEVLGMCDRHVSLDRTVPTHHLEDIAEREECTPLLAARAANSLVEGGTHTEPQGEVSCEPPTHGVDYFIDFAQIIGASSLQRCFSAKLFNRCQLERSIDLQMARVRGDEAGRARIAASIESRNVSFRHSDAGPWIARGVNAVFPPRVHVALVGPPGLEADVAAGSVSACCSRERCTSSPAGLAPDEATSQSQHRSYRSDIGLPRQHPGASDSALSRVRGLQSRRRRVPPQPASRRRVQEAC